MTAVIQRSMAGGEIAPSLYPRCDLSKYATGLKTMRNSMVKKSGGSQNRPGSQWVCDTKFPSKRVRLIEFIFNNTQTNMLEFGDQYIRFISDGAQLTGVSRSIAGISNASTGVLTYSGADAYENGDSVFVSGVVGAIAPYVNGRTFRVGSVDHSAKTFNLLYLDGTPVNTTSWGAYTSGGTGAIIYEVASPYAEADLPALQFVQSADIIFIVHPSYAPRKLSRLSANSWTLSLIVFAPSVARPANITATELGSAGSFDYYYAITAVNSKGEESLTGKSFTFAAISAITKANPAKVTTTFTHEFFEGEEVYLQDIVGMTELNGRFFTIHVVDTTHFELVGIDSSAYTTYSSAGKAYPTSHGILSVAQTSDTDKIQIAWDAQADAQYYNVYRLNNGTPGFIGSTRFPVFEDDGSVIPNTANTPPFVDEVFNEANDYPSCISLGMQQRLILANTNNEPEKVWESAIGSYFNFSARLPIQDSDSFNFIIAGREVNAVRHLLDIGASALFSQAGEWIIQGDQSGIISPATVNPKQYTYNGSGDLRPLSLEGSALYVQAQGSIVRDFAFDINVDGYRGNDLTNFSAHLFKGKEIADWSYQKTPHSIVWAVMDDGSLLGLTYIKDQTILGWHRHDTDGTYENVCCIPEGSEHSIYTVVNRTIGSQTKRYIERFATRVVDEIADSIFMDAALQYDGTNTGVRTMTLSGGTTWGYKETLTLTASSGFFTSADVGNEIHFLNATTGAVVLKFKIKAFSSTTVVTGKPIGTVPVSLRTTATTHWARAVDHLSGLWHLEGKQISILGDGYVIASPNNMKMPVVTVANGACTLPSNVAGSGNQCFIKISAGLPYISDLKTLDIDNPNSETLTDKQKLVTQVVLHVEETRGVWVGGENPDTNLNNSSNDPLFQLTEYKAREFEAYNSPIDLKTDKIKINIDGRWDSNGSVFIRQVDPLPIEVNAITPVGDLPFK